MSTTPIAMRDAMLNSIWKAMSTRNDIQFVTADFGSPILDKIRADHPDHFLNVGIAEQNLINVSVGLALEGYTVFAYAIAPFITMRCYEQIRVNIALLSTVRPMNINLIGVGAGYSYVVSGPTHQCYEDITIMRALPGVQILSPADHVVAEALVGPCISNIRPKYLRLDAQLVPNLYGNFSYDINQGFHIHRKGSRVCLIATGYMVHTAMQVADLLEEKGIAVGLIDLWDLSHFNESALKESLSHYQGFISVEEGFRGKGGLDAMLFDFISRNDLSTRLLNLGVEGGYRFELGSRQDLHEQMGIGLHSMASSTTAFHLSFNSIGDPV